MTETAIKVVDMSKQYRLGVIGTGTISHDLNRWWARMRGKEDPYLQIGETNDRSLKSTSDYVWALKDINLEVKKGEVLGVIGKNGAGKSTLLKILSKVTGPTTGKIYAKGRIGALLEVGTGFHPELTGRENIFLNGAILGMTKLEIRSKIDEIIDFSGCARYVDTPVKRYSSGMKVRLAFAVAAFLEPEILIVDEVLAVGDAEFQRKAIGKMKDVSEGEGRAVLFVSHNMGSVSQLCSRAILMENGMISMNGGVQEVIDNYLSGIETQAETIFNDVQHLDCFVSAVRFKAEDGTVRDQFDITESVSIEFVFTVKGPKPLTGFGFTFYRGGVPLFVEYSSQGEYDQSFHQRAGTYVVTYQLPAMLLKEGKYLVKLACYDSTTQYYYDEQPSFQLNSNFIDTTNKSFRMDRAGEIIPQGIWTVAQQ